MTTPDRDQPELPIGALEAALPTDTALTYACGVVQGERRFDRAVATRDVTTDAQGRVTHLTLLVPGPSGTPFALAVRIVPGTDGAAILQARDMTPGTTLHVTGRLVWEQTADPRFATAWTEVGRRALDAVLYATAVRAATEDDVPGCDVNITGTVVGQPRIGTHPLSGERIYTARLAVRTSQPRPHSRAMIHCTQRVTVSIPRDHADALSLLRTDNVVHIEGLLERLDVPISLNNRALQRKMAAEEAAWEEQEAALAARGAAAQIPRERHKWERQQRKLMTVTSCRIAAGYVGLMSGTPLSRAEQRTLDRGRRGAADGRERRQQVAPASVADGNDMVPAGDGADRDPTPPVTVPTRARRRTTTHADDASEASSDLDASTEEPPAGGISSDAVAIAPPEAPQPVVVVGETATQELSP